MHSKATHQSVEISHTASRMTKQRCALHRSATHRTVLGATAAFTLPAQKLHPKLFTR